MNVRSSSRMGLRTVSVLVALAVVASLLSAAPAAFAATPTGDCGSGTFPSNCPVAVYSTVSSSPISTTGLNTANSGDLVIAIVVAQSGDTISTPTVGGTSMSGPVCTYVSSAGQVEIWYLYEASPITSKVVSVSVTGKGTDGIGLIAFGVSGASSTAAIDGSCGTGSSSTNASPSVTLSGLSYSNDFIIGGVLASGSGSGVSGIAATSPTALITSGTGSGAAKGGNAAGYQSGGSQTSQTVAFSISPSGNVASWEEVAVALEASSTTPIPFFPQGAIPVIVATLGAYLIMRKRLQRRAEARVV